MNAAGLGLGMLVVLLGGLLVFAVCYSALTRIELSRERRASVRSDAQNRVLRRELNKCLAAEVAAADQRAAGRRHLLNSPVTDDFFRAAMNDIEKAWNQNEDGTR